MKHPAKPRWIVAEKDKNLRIENCNTAFIECAGIKSPDHAIGLTVYDTWSEYADSYRAHELDALAGKNYSAIIPVKDYQGNHLLFLQTKLQKTDENNRCCGVLCYAIEILNPHMHKLFQFLNSNQTTNKKLYLNKKSNRTPLSKRQEEVLFFLIRGKSAKMIAKVMNISHRTVEYYVETIKNKYHCFSKSELIEYAIDNGLGQNLPANHALDQLLKKLSA